MTSTAERPEELSALEKARTALLTAPDLKALKPESVLGLSRQQLNYARAVKEVDTEAHHRGVPSGAITVADKDDRLLLSRNGVDFDQDEVDRLLAVLPEHTVTSFETVPFTLPDGDDRVVVSFAPMNEHTEKIAVGDMSVLHAPRPGKDSRAGEEVRFAGDAVARWETPHLLRMYLLPGESAVGGEVVFTAGGCTVLQSVLNSAWEQRPSASVAPLDDDTVAAVQALDLVLALSTMQEAAKDKNSLVTDAEAELETLNSNIARAEESLFRLLRQRTEKTEQIIGMRQEPEVFAREQIALLLAEAEQVAKHPIVRSVAPDRCPKCKKHPVALDVLLHPLVLRYESKNYLLSDLRFHLCKSSRNVHFQRAPQDHWPHPHIGNNYGACLGEAQAPFADAVARGEYATALTLLAGWCQQVNSAHWVVRLGHTPLTSFPVTDLEPGWHPELP